MEKNAGFIRRLYHPGPRAAPTRFRPRATIHGRPSLNSGTRRFIAASTKERFMLALYIIFGFVGVLAVINFIEFGRVD